MSINPMMMNSECATGIVALYNEDEFDAIDIPAYCEITLDMEQAKSLKTLANCLMLGVEGAGVGAEGARKAQRLTEIRIAMVEGVSTMFSAVYMNEELKPLLGYSMFTANTTLIITARHISLSTIIPEFVNDHHLFSDVLMLPSHAAIAALTEQDDCCDDYISNGWAHVKRSEKELRSGAAIAIVWTAEDVICNAIQQGLHVIPTEHEARCIIAAIARGHSAEIGVDWDLITVYTTEYMRKKGHKNVT